MRTAGLLLLSLAGVAGLAAQEAVLAPAVDGEWWTIAGNPDVGPYTTPQQQPVDFGIWQATDDTWQMWSCIRKTSLEGRTRLLYRWEGTALTDRDWKPMGVAMMADAAFGETPGGLQAPYVRSINGLYRMFYGDWVNICLATGVDGKTFARQLTSSGRAGMFHEGSESNARDPMVLKAGDRYYIYYTAHPDRRGSVYCRTSTDLRNWSASKIVATGGSAGTAFNSAECPFVFHHQDSGFFYLFRTHRYGEKAQTSVYRSKDPLDFGIDDDRCLVTRLAVAAPEIIVHQGEHYIASLLPSLKGIRVARLKWVKEP